MYCNKFFFVLIGLGLGTSSSVRADEFSIKDQDTVAFLGDSITAARTYSKIIENYVLLRFPERNVRFINAGIGGDTAVGGLKRLERDIFAHKATILIVAFGINDIGWGTKADEAHKKAYLEAIRGIVKACLERKVRVYICSAAATAEDPSRSEEGFLQKMCDEGMAISRSLGAQSIDVQRTMRGIQKRIWAANKQVADKSKQDTLHTSDGVHLNDLGQLAMAYAMLKELGAPSEVSSCILDAQDTETVKSTSCAISDVSMKDGQLKFTRHDQGLPFNYGIFYTLNYRFIPFPDELNRYMLKILNLPKGRYEVVVEGRSAGNFFETELAAGVNIASTTGDVWQPGGPWDAQANILKPLTEARHELANSKGNSRDFFPTAPTAEQLEKQVAKVDDQLVEMQRAVARPQPYRFVIRPFKSSKN
jgi:lysophospholipase L1-like esterase